MTGDTTDGFVINAKYIGEDIATNEPENTNQENSDLINENVSNPKTSDNIMIYIILFILSVIGIIGSIKYLNYKKN